MDSFKPLVRFAGFEGEWEKVKLGDCLEISTEKNEDNTYGINEVLSVSDEEGVVNQIQLLGRSYAGKSVSSYKVLKTNQIVYTKSPLKAKPFGIIKVNKGDIGIVSVLYAVFDAKKGVFPDFIHYYFEPPFRINNYLHPLIKRGAKNTMNISDIDSLQGEIAIPCSIEEQQSISNYFTKLDEELTLQTQKLSKLKQIKAASLQNMFPQEGQTVPLVRFSGFGGEWEKVPFAEIAVRAEQSGVSGELPGVEYDDIVSGQGILNKDILKKECVKCGKLFHSGDILFGKLRPYLKNILFADFDGVAVGDFWVLRSTNSVNRFLYTIVNSYSFMKVANVSSGSKMPRADWKLVSSTRFAVPPTIEEQQAIANYFTKLDRKIELETQKLEKLKQIKSACLSKMFV